MADAVYAPTIRGTLLAPRQPLHHAPVSPVPSTSNRTAADPACDTPRQRDTTTVRRNPQVSQGDNQNQMLRPFSCSGRNSRVISAAKRLA
jgi:hypothetical protein